MNMLCRSKQIGIENAHHVTETLFVTRNRCISSYSQSKSLHGCNKNNYCINTLQLISKRYRKRPAEKTWKYMWAGKYPFGKIKGIEETEEQLTLRKNRILKNRRRNGRNFMDWLYMPHLQYMLNFDKRIAKKGYYKRGTHMTNDEINEIYNEYLIKTENKTENEQEIETNNETSNDIKIDTETDEELSKTYDTEFDYDYLENYSIWEYEMPIDPWDEQKLLKELNSKYSNIGINNIENNKNNKNNKNNLKTIRMKLVITQNQ